MGSPSMAPVVLWDIDGTLVNGSAGGDLRFERRAVARALGCTDAEDGFVAVHGTTADGLFLVNARSRGLDDVAAEARLPQFRKALLEVIAEATTEYRSEFRPTPGATEAMAWLHRAGIVQTVLTGNPRDVAVFKLATLGIETQLDLDIGAYGSDNRDRDRLGVVALERLRRRGWQGRPSEISVIGDTPADVGCARAGGFRAVAVATGPYSREALERHAPDALLDDLLDVQALRAALGDRPSAPRFGSGGGV
jgi:phosphoglycolate phosphatase